MAVGKRWGKKKRGERQNISYRFSVSAQQLAAGLQTSSSKIERRVGVSHATCNLL
jgi:hypothetical protein